MCEGKLSSHVTHLFFLPEQSDTPFILLLSFGECALLMVIFYELWYWHYCMHPLFTGSGGGSGKAWGCDLSYKYVEINAEYTTWNLYSSWKSVFNSLGLFGRSYNSEHCMILKNSVVVPIGWTCILCYKNALKYFRTTCENCLPSFSVMIDNEGWHDQIKFVWSLCTLLSVDYKVQLIYRYQIKFSISV
jgi:hypothetical protein